MLYCDLSCPASSRLARTSRTAINRVKWSQFKTNNRTNVITDDEMSSLLKSQAWATNFPSPVVNNKQNLHLDTNWSSSQSHLVKLVCATA